MPIYEYECTKCGSRFERLVSFNEQPKISCDSCNGKHIRRILSTGAFVFKGSGFYATDYKKTEKKKESGEKPSEGCKACPSTDKCPAAAGE